MRRRSMTPDSRILRRRPRLFGCCGVADDDGVPGATTPQIDALPNSEPNGGNKTHKVDPFGTVTSHRRLRAQQYIFILLKNPTFFLLENPTFFLLRTSPAKFPTLSKRDEFFPASRPPFFCLSLLGRKEISAQRRGAAKVCFVLISGLFLVVSTFVEQGFLLRRGVRCPFTTPSQRKLTFIFKSSLHSKNA